MLSVPPGASEDPRITTSMHKTSLLPFMSCVETDTQCLVLALGICSSSFFFRIFIQILWLHLKAKGPSVQFLSLTIPIKMAHFYGLSLPMFLSYGPFANELRQVATLTNQCLLILNNSQYLSVAACVADVLLSTLNTEPLNESTRQELLLLF